MEYNDESLLSPSQYEDLAKAYNLALTKKGLKVVSIDDNICEDELNQLFSNLSNIKALLFTLGGFLNTSTFYSLNERQIRKFCVIFDRESIPSSQQKTRDKTKCFLSFLSCEFALTSQLIHLCEKSRFENEIKTMIHQRLQVLSQILSL